MRKRALDVVFAADARNRDPIAVMTEREGHDELPPMGDYAEQIVRGVAAHHRRIDAVLADHSHGWALDRMPAVDLAILRVGVWELIYSDTPGAVVVDQAVELARSLSTDDSPGFVNGVLGRLLDLKPMLAPTPSELTDSVD